MPLPILCDEHISYRVIAGLEHQGIDAMSIRRAGLRTTDDPVILVAARQLERVIYTYDDDFLRLNAEGISHLGILYHHPHKYSIGQAINAVALACQVLAMEEMRNRVEYL